MSEIIGKLDGNALVKVTFVDEPNTETGVPATFGEGGVTYNNTTHEFKGTITLGTETHAGARVSRVLPLILPNA